MEAYIGIDIGGMTIKGIALDIAGAILAEDAVETGVAGGGEAICANIARLINNLVTKLGAQISDFKGVGMCSPGLIDSASGTVIYAANLRLKNYPLAQNVSSLTSLPVKVVNDANAAALGEAKFGAGKKYSDSVLITLGTGVGSGVIIGGKLFEGFKSAGAELGHMVIAEGGLPCSCGRHGCFEAYSSATALMAKTREAMKSDTTSEMWKEFTPETVSGRTPFLYAETDYAARCVVEWYVKYLACGLANVANIFRPQIIMLGGGISEQGEVLLAPLRKEFEKQLFGGTDYAPVQLAKATLGSRAGAFGAAALLM